jgi:heme-degrading monooxygenase HmoA
VILEVAILNIRPGRNRDFEAAFAESEPIVIASPRHMSHEVRRCLEVDCRYLLLVRWETLQAHAGGFGQSEPYLQRTSVGCCIRRRMPTRGYGAKGAGRDRSGGLHVEQVFAIPVRRRRLTMICLSARPQNDVSH